MGWIWRRANCAKGHRYNCRVTDDNSRLTNGKLQDPFIAPLPDGGLELEWELDAGVELTLIVPREGRGIKYLLDVPNNEDGFDESEGLLPRDATLSELLGGHIL